VSRALLLALQPDASILAPRRFVDGHPVEPHWASHVRPVALVPGEVPFRAIERPLSWPEHFEGLGFVEHVLVEHFAVHVSPGQDLLHEPLEVAPGGGFRLSSRDRWLCRHRNRRASQKEDREDGARRRKIHVASGRAGWPPFRRGPAGHGSLFTLLRYDGAHVSERPHDRATCAGDR